MEGPVPHVPSSPVQPHMGYLCPYPFPHLEETVWSLFPNALSLTRRAAALRQKQGRHVGHIRTWHLQGDAPQLLCPLCPSRMALLTIRARRGPWSGGSQHCPVSPSESSASQPSQSSWHRHPRWWKSRCHSANCCPQHSEWGKPGGGEPKTPASPVGRSAACNPRWRKWSRPERRNWLTEHGTEEKKHWENHINHPGKAPCRAGDREGCGVPGIEPGKAGLGLWRDYREDRTCHSPPAGAGSWHRVGLWHSIQLALRQGCLVLLCLQAGGFQLLLVHVQSTNLSIRPCPACL